jgi:hypothetical protein
MNSTNNFTEAPVANVLLAEIGNVLYGPRWQTDLARDLGISDRTMRRWAANVADVPPGAWRDFHHRLESRNAELERMKHRISGLLGAREMTLQPIPNARPEWQIDGIYFWMRRPDGRNIPCVARRSIFDDQGQSTPKDAVRFFAGCSQTFHLAASVKFDMGEFNESQGIILGSSDVIPFPNVL